MKLNADTLKLALRIESIIGNSCHNPNSYDGRTGEWGKSFRYPIMIPVEREDGTYWEKSWYTLSEYATPENFKSACYKFGSNELGIGKAILKVLDEIEKRYGLDFNQLEESRKDDE